MQLSADATANVTRSGSVSNFAAAIVSNQLQGRDVLPIMPTNATRSKRRIQTKPKPIAGMRVHSATIGIALAICVSSCGDNSESAIRESGGEITLPANQTNQVSQPAGNLDSEPGANPAGANKKSPPNPNLSEQTGEGLSEAETNEPLGNLTPPKSNDQEIAQSIAGTATTSKLDAAAIKLAQSKIGFANLPQSATNFDVSTDAGQYSAGFKIIFDAPLPDVEAWLKASKATQNVEPKRQGTIRTFNFEIDGLAESRIVVNEIKADTGQVAIYAFVK